MDEKLQSIECPSCGKSEGFIYKGPLELVKVHELYDCMGCGSTMTYENIMSNKSKRPMI